MITRKKTSIIIIINIYTYYAHTNYIHYCPSPKGLNGSGYGPVSTAGLIIIKVHPKKSVGSTILSEGIVCAMGFLIFIMLCKASISLNLLTFGITAESCLASFLGSYITKKINPNKLKIVIATFIILLGVYTLFQSFLLR